MAKIRAFKKTNPVINEIKPTPAPTPETIEKNEKKEEKASILNSLVEEPASYSKVMEGTYTTTTRVNLRAGADMLKPILVVVPYQAKVQCEGYYTNEWVFVRYNGITGFMLKKYLR